MAGNSKEFDVQRNLPRQRISSHQLCKLNKARLRRGYKGNVFVSHIKVAWVYDAFFL